MSSTGVHTVPPRRAIVVPRGSVDGGETLPLETHVRAAWRRGARRFAIVGPGGSGRTTAVAHLEAVLDDLPIDFADGPAFLPVFADRPLLSAFDRPPEEPNPFELVMRLAPWGEAEWIDYLLAKHPQQVRPVMGRLKRCDHLDDLEGSPRLWTLVLDQFATRPELTDVRDLLRRTMRVVLAMLGDAAGEARSRMASALLAGKEAALPTGVPAVLHHPVMLRLGLADHVADLIARDVFDLDRWPRLMNEPADLLMIADRLRSEPAIIARLQTLLEQTRFAHPVEGLAQPALVSLLVATDDRWTPPMNARYLPCVRAAGVKWRGMPLRYCRLAQADLSGADISRADLTGSHAEAADFRGADLSQAILADANLRKACFDGASLTGAILRHAMLQHASAVTADFNDADLEDAVLYQADLRGASFRNARLVGANLTATLLAAADLTGARLDDATCLDIDPRETILNQVSARRATFTRVDFGGCEIRGLSLQSCVLTGSDFTGSVFRDASLVSSIFRQAGLADVDWEGADLRDCDFTHASFHMGSSRSGLVFSPIACEGSRTGFYTDDYAAQDYQPPEAIRKANLCGANLVGAEVTRTDWYLVDLRGAKYTIGQAEWFRKCGAILFDRGGD